MKTIVSNVCARALVAVALAGAALSASADLLYWTVTDAKGNASSGKEGQAIPFAYATVSVDNGASYLTIYNESGSTGESKLFVSEGLSGTSTGAVYAGLFDSSVTSFLVELWNENESRVGWQSYGTSAVADSIWHGDKPSGTGATAFVVSAVVPEPTSGMLLMLGGALLALRRRRTVIA